MSERHVHEWVPTDRPGILAWACETCDETSASCGTCSKPTGTSLLLCERCREHADTTIGRIDRAIELWQPSLSRPDGTRFRRGDEGGPDANDVESQLLGWVARWSEHVGACNEHWSTFLKGHHIWAAHNVEASDWPAYWRAIHHLMWKARGEAGLLPHVEPLPCVHCGEDVVRDWSDDDFEPLAEGLSDTVRCTGCGMTWRSPQHWGESTWKWFERGAQEHEDALVTLEMARTLWPDVPMSTMRSWIKRDEARYSEGVERAQEWWARQPEIGPVTQPPAVMRNLPSYHRTIGTRHLADGVTVERYDPEPRYRVGDLAEYSEWRTDDTRRGPKVGAVSA